MKTQERTRLLRILQDRFEKNMHRHKRVAWEDVFSRLDASPTALTTLAQMEASGGEPDVIAQIEDAGPFTWCDCSPESPSGRRSLCYDREALDARKENRPAGSAASPSMTCSKSVLGTLRRQPATSWWKSAWQTPHCRSKTS